MLEVSGRERPLWECIVDGGVVRPVEPELSLLSSCTFLAEFPVVFFRPILLRMEDASPPRLLDERCSVILLLFLLLLLRL